MPIKVSPPPPPPPPPPIPREPEQTAYFEKLDVFTSQDYPEIFCRIFEKLVLREIAVSLSIDMTPQETMNH